MPRLVVVVALLAVACKQEETQPAAKKAVTPAAAPDAAAAQPTPDPVPKGPSSAEYAMKYSECLSYALERKGDELAGCYAESAVGEVADGGPPATGGKAIVAGVWKPLWDAFPDLAVEGQLMLVNGRQIAVLALLKGKNDGPVMGKKPTGKTVGFVGARLTEMDEQQRITRDALYANLGEMLAQLGLAGPVAPAQTGWTEMQVMVTAGDNPELEAKNVAAVEAWIAKVSAKDADALAPNAAVKDHLGAPPPERLDKKAIWGAGDYVVLQGERTATDPKTKKAITVKTAEIYKLKDGKVVEGWVVGNVAGAKSK
jgi:hypothetical protein